jgi:hypothetical protein
MRKGQRKWSAFSEDKWPTLDETEAVYGSRALSLVQLLRGDVGYVGICGLREDEGPYVDPHAPPRPPRLKRPPKPAVARALRLMFYQAERRQYLVCSARYGHTVAEVWPVARLEPCRMWVEDAAAPAWPRRFALMQYPPRANPLSDEGRWDASDRMEG